MDPPISLGCRTCQVCLGPVHAGFARCYQCDLAKSEAGDLLADAVVPVGYAIRGEQLATDLRLYKSDRDGAADAAKRLRSMLAAFLRDQGSGLWRAAGMAAAPSAVAVVPSGQGRPGAHPLTGIVASCVDLPVTRLAVRLLPSSAGGGSASVGSAWGPRRRGGRAARRRHVGLGRQRPVGRGRAQARRRARGSPRGPRTSCGPGRSEVGRTAARAAVGGLIRVQDDATNDLSVV